MDVSQIPFGRLVGLVRSHKEDIVLELPESDDYHNHLGTVHASAQFTLAESASGEYLLHIFPDLVGNVAPMVRGVNVKYRKPAHGRLFAKASCDENVVEKVYEDLEKRGLARITVAVKIFDQNEVNTMKAKVDWVIYMIEE